MMDKGPNQKYVDIWPLTFQNDDTINDQLENTCKFSVALKPKSPLNYVVYTISESNLTPHLSSLHFI